MPTSAKLDKAKVLKTSSARSPEEEKADTSGPVVSIRVREETRRRNLAARERPDLFAAFIERQLAQLQNSLPAVLTPEYPASFPQPPAAAEPMEQDSFLIHNGVPYMPLPDAARYAGVHRETLLTWMRNQATFGGEPLETLYFKPTGNHFISKRSVESILNRFERWPSAEPAGAISLLATGQGSEYLSMSDAADKIGVPGGTLRRWIRQGNAPLETPLTVVRDTSSGYFYIQHQDVLRLAEHVKQHGLSRGPRSQASSAPS